LESEEMNPQEASEAEAMDALQIAEESGHKPRTGDVVKSHAAPIKPFINLRISRDTHAEIGLLEREIGMRTKSATVTWLVDNVKRQNLIRPASRERVFENDTPTVISGPPGWGKTTFAKDEIVPGTTPLLVLDVVGDYPSLRKVTLPQLLGLNWRRHNGLQIRFIPSVNPILFSAEMSSLFTQLNSIKSDGFKPGTIPSGLLKDWTLLLEESHRLKSIEAFNLFLLEARKYLRKIILICSNPDTFGAYCTTLKPERRKV
jgi:hypothetical protein